MKTIVNDLDLLKKNYSLLFIKKIEKKTRFTIICNQINNKSIHPDNAKEHYQSYLNKKNKKLVKRSKIITQQPKLIENSNIIDLKSVTIEHPKTSHKLSKTVSQDKKKLALEKF